MKKAWLIAASLAAALGATSAFAAPVSLSPGVYIPSADAPQRIEARLRRHTCVARSRTSVGYEVSTSLAVARAGALAQCAVRTRRGLVCVLVSCT
jgi:hypothetical protein